MAFKFLVNFNLFVTALIILSSIFKEDFNYYYDEYSSNYFTIWELKEVFMLSYYFISG